MVLRLFFAATSLVLCMVSAQVRAADDAISLLSLNLHGYHPTGESQRWFQSRTGDVLPALNHLFYFSTTELARGHERRLDQLAARVDELAPDVVLLQEVGAGWPRRANNCDDFYADASADQDWGNSALRLNARLKRKRYRSVLACRGNVGWRTDDNTFAAARIVEDGGNVIFNFGANPYPMGMLVEGFAILVSDKWRVTESGLWHLRQNYFGDTFQVQYAVVVPSGVYDPERAVGIINIHGGHKVGHFEQAVALREAMSGLMRTTKIPPQSWIVGGDFNVSLYRPTHEQDEIDASAVAWEVSASSFFDFDLRANTKEKTEQLRRLLTSLNNNRAYKDYATILDRSQAAQRIEAAVARFQRWQERIPPADYQLVEALALATTTKKCQPANVSFVSCNATERIDNIFFGGAIKLQNAFMTFVDSSSQHLRGMSDHPGIFASFSLSTNSSRN